MFWFRSVVLSVVSMTMIGVMGGSAIAQSPVNFGSSRPSATMPTVKNGEQLVKELNLTTRQVQQLKAVRQKFQRQMQEQRQLLNTAKQELAESIAGNAPAAKIRGQRDRVKILQKQLNDLKFDNMMALKEILTTEQWAKLQKLKQQRTRSTNGNY
jgi:periplasmic protein CpxP/Spy